MAFTKIKSYAKINLALNITGKNSFLHEIESIVSFVLLHDDILIKKIKSKDHNISFTGKFSKKIGKNNTIFKLLKVLEERKLLKDKKFRIRVNKQIPIEAGLGGGSMNAASILRYLIKKKIIQTSKKEILEICKLIGSDVILGLNTKNSIITKKNEIKYFDNCKKFYTLIVKPNFGCSTEYIYSKVNRFNKPLFNRPQKKMFDYNFLKKSHNQLELIAFSEYPKLKIMKMDLENLFNADFVRMSGSGSALVAYFLSKRICEYAKKKFRKKYKNYWCIASKTI